MNEVPFPVADSRFDQKNEMFKRSVWADDLFGYGRPVSAEEFWRS